MAERMSLLRRIEVRVLEEPVRLLRIVAKTGGPAHWSVWGQPSRLASCVIDVEQVAR